MKPSTIRATIATGTVAVLIGVFTVTAPAAQAAETCFGLTPTIVGTPGGDTLIGTEGPDVIVGLGGADDIRALGGDDVVCAGANTPPSTLKETSWGSTSCTAVSGTT
jgi:Ca2+-binding RTX toxin-like protein